MTNTKKENKNKQTQIKDKEENIDDIIIEPEQQEGVSSFTKSESSEVQKLKKQLKIAKQEAKDNLDGWQRLKADMANSQKTQADKLKQERERGAQEVLKSLLPALDSFDSAMQGDAWESIDNAWRQGMEFVYTQLISALQEHNIESFGVEGDEFDSTIHEASEHKSVEQKSQNNKILKILQKGYKSENGVIRPARVIVGDFKS